MITLPRTSGCCDGHFSQFSDVLLTKEINCENNRQIIIIIVSYSPINKCMMCALLHLLPQPTVMSWCIEWHVIYITATRWVKPLKVSKNNKKSTAVKLLFKLLALLKFKEWALLRGAVDVWLRLLIISWPGDSEVPVECLWLF